MATHIAVNYKEHAKIKIDTNNLIHFGANVSNTLTFATEFAEIQRDFPILFSKNPDNGKFQAVVLMGLEQDENLFLTNGQWQAKYLPSVIAKGPFLIGFETQKETSTEKAIICLDIDAPCVNQKEGENLFIEQGENSPFLNKIIQTLMIINDGNQLNQNMFTAFNKHELIEAITLDIKLNNGKKIKIAGNYTINAKKLSSLSGKALAELNQAGFLQLAFFIVASLNNVQHLIDLKNLQCSK